MKQLIFADLPVYKDVQYKEMLNYLINNGKIAKNIHGYYWTDTKSPLGERPEVVLPKCPDCGVRHVKTTPDCDNVYGRRGFRQLGEYDT